MELTAAQQKYFVYWLTRSLPSDRLDKLTASLLVEKVRLQQFFKDLEKRCSEKRLNLYQAQDDVDEKKETLLTKVEAMLSQKIEQTS